MSADHPVPLGFKRCTRAACRALLPATTKYFYARDPMSGSLRNECACCTRADARRRFVANPERHRELVAANKLRLKAERGYTWRPRPKAAP